MPQPIITQVILQGSQIGISNDRAVEGLQNFAEVRVLVAVGDAIVQWLTYDIHQSVQTVTAYCRVNCNQTLVREPRGKI